MDLELRKFRRSVFNMSSKSPPPEVAERIQLRKEIKEEVGSHPIVMYSKPNCGYCDLAKDLFSRERIQFKEVDLNSLTIRYPDKSQYKNYISALIDLTRLKTVPQIFICGKFIGGYMDLSRLHDEKRLHELLDECQHGFQ